MQVAGCPPGAATACERCALPPPPPPLACVGTVQRSPRGWTWPHSGGCWWTLMPRPTRFRPLQGGVQSRGGGQAETRSACGVWGGPAHALLYRTSSLYRTSWLLQEPTSRSPPRPRLRLQVARQQGEYLAGLFGRGLVEARAGGQAGGQGGDLTLPAVGLTAEAQPFV